MNATIVYAENLVGEECLQAVVFEDECYTALEKGAKLMGIDLSLLEFNEDEMSYYGYEWVLTCAYMDEDGLI